MTEKELQEIDARIAELEAQSDEYERQIKELEEKKRLEKWWMECKSQYRYEHIKQKTKARTREHM